MSAAATPEAYAGSTHDHHALPGSMPSLPPMPASRPRTLHLRRPIPASPIDPRGSYTAKPGYRAEGRHIHQGLDRANLHTKCLLVRRSRKLGRRRANVLPATACYSYVEADGNAAVECCGVPMTIDEALREAYIMAEKQAPAVRDHTRAIIKRIQERRATATQQGAGGAPTHPKDDPAGGSAL